MGGTRQAEQDLEAELDQGDVGLPPDEAGDPRTLGRGHAGSPNSSQTTASRISRSSISGLAGTR
jgi:hypothetical protein